MTPFKVTIFGAGNIGTALAGALASGGDFAVTLAERTDEALDGARESGLPVSFRAAHLPEAMRVLAAGQDMIVAAVPDRAVPQIAALAAEAGAHYLDFSRPAAETLRLLRPLAERRAALVGCGASPGLVENVTADLVANFSSVEDLTVRVGAIPRFAANRLGYGRIWNMDGLFDEYMLPSAGLRDGRPVMLTPLEGYERFTIDGVAYEAFITSGGMGALEGAEGRLQNLTFKTIRHPGHLDYMRFLLDDLGLSRRRDMLKSLLCNGLPVVEDDVVLFFITARGLQGRQLVERSVFHRLAPAFQAGRFNALTRVAAGYAATLIAMLREEKIAGRGFVEHSRLANAPLMESPFLRTSAA